MNQPAPLLVAMIISAFIAGSAWRAHSLTTSGAVAAFVVGSAALTAAWSWGALLIAWFILSSLLSRLGRAKKAARVAAVVVKGDRRDASQVLANGGVFFVASLMVIVVTRHFSDPTRANQLLAIGATASLAAAAADTWATEIGTLFGDRPWSLRLRKRVAVGTSGAITASGTSGLLAGGAIISTLAALFAVVPQDVMTIASVAIGGVAGAFADTLIGAWLQERRWCATCKLDTEQIIHSCGNQSERSGGIAKLDNDAVNALCTLTGAAVAVLLRLG